MKLAAHLLMAILSVAFVFYAVFRTDSDAMWTLACFVGMAGALAWLVRALDLMEGRIR